MFLHGWTMRGAVFDDLIARLPRDISCQAPDLPGHGARADLTPSLDAAVDLVVDLLKESERPVVLVGWSMGAAIAWRFIERFGAARLAGLVTVDMSPRLANENGWSNGLIRQYPEDVARTTVRMKQDWPGVAQAIATTMFANPAGAAIFNRDAALRQILSNDPQKVIPLWEDLVAMDLRHIIPHVSCPALVVCGGRSRVYPASAAAWLAESLPSGTQRIFANSGHSPHLEEPDTFARCLVKFVRSL